jgi:hypothetical protein
MFSTAGATASSGMPGRRRAGLVELHLAHPVGRLEADPAGVEGDALAHERQVSTTVGGRLAGTQHDQARRVVAPPSDGHEQAHAHPLGLLGTEHLDGQVVLPGERRGLVGEHLGADVVSGAVRERAREIRPLPDGSAAFRGLYQARDVGTGRSHED